jgi:hypothetical protein
MGAGFSGKGKGNIRCLISSFTKGATSASINKIKCSIKWIEEP